MREKGSVCRENRKPKAKKKEKQTFCQAGRGKYAPYSLKGGPAHEA